MLELINNQASEYQANKAAKEAQKLHRMSKNSDDESHAKIRAAAQNFEGMFLGQMLENLFDGVPTNELFGGGDAEEIYRSMMIDEYGKMMAKSGGIGVADHVMRQMLQTQEGKL